jgi:glucose-6-phosphate 1-dehydrogenase
VYWKMNVKAPGLQNRTYLSELDLTFKHRFPEARLPDAYERLILDVVTGDHSNFVRGDELEAAWNLFTPLLDEIEASSVKPHPYSFGTRGPVESDELIKSVGFERTTAYHWVGTATTDEQIDMA